MTDPGGNCGGSLSDPVTRRRFFAGVTAVGTAALAGCLDGDDGSNDEATDAVESGEQVDDVEEGRRLNGEALRSFFPIQLYEGHTDERVAEVHYHEDFSHWHFVPFEIPLDGYRPVEARVYNDDGEVIPLGPDEQFQLQITRTEETPEDLLEIEINGLLVNFHGKSPGEGELLFHLAEDEETVWTTPQLSVVVVDETESE